LGGKNKNVIVSWGLDSSFNDVQGEVYYSQSLV